MKVREVVVRYRNPRKAAEQIREPQAAVDLFRRIVPDNSREHFLAIYTDARHRPIGYRIVSTGSLDQSLIHPREILQPAILIGAAAILVGHNHPSGDPGPSQEDRDVTARLKKASELLELRFLDSLVFTDAGQWRKVEP